jgi:hypothetical protein
LSVTPIGSPKSVFKTNTCTVSLPEYGQKDDDFIVVQVTAIKDEFTYLFTLRNPVPLNDLRPSVRVPKPIGCSNLIKDEGRYLPSGRLGFFAVDGTRFRVEEITVTPLKQN